MITGNLDGSRLRFPATLCAIPGSGREIHNLPDQEEDFRLDMRLCSSRGTDYLVGAHGGGCCFSIGGISACRGVHTRLNPDNLIEFCRRRSGSAGAEHED